MTLNITISALGIYDGNVYEELWKRVQTEPLNQTEVTEGYEVSKHSLRDENNSDACTPSAEYQASSSARQGAR